jgi:hypothetical protein
VERWLGLHSPTTLGKPHPHRVWLFRLRWRGRRGGETRGGDEGDGKRRKWVKIKATFGDNFEGENRIMTTNAQMNYFYELCDDVQEYIIKMGAKNMIQKNYKNYCTKKKLVSLLCVIPEEEDLVVDSSFVAFLFYLSRNPSIKFTDKNLIIRATWRNLYKLSKEIRDLDVNKQALYCAAYEYAAILLDNWVENEDDEGLEYLLTLQNLQKKVWQALYCVAYEYATILLDNEDDEGLEHLLTLPNLQKKVWQSMLNHL